MTRVKRLVLLSNALSQRKFHSQSRACTLQHVSLSVPVDSFLWRNPPRFTVESENLANLWVLGWLTSTRPGWRIAGQCATATNVSKAGGSGNLSIFTSKAAHRSNLTVQLIFRVSSWLCTSSVVELFNSTFLQRRHSWFNKSEVDLALLTRLHATWNLTNIAVACRHG